MSMLTGTAFVQPAAHELPSQAIELVGATVSAWAVKPVPVPVRPAPFCAVTDPVPVSALDEKL
jgi:hypothetical protein